MWGEIYPRILFTEKDFPPRRGNCCTTIQTFCPRETGQEKGRGRGKTAIFLLFPTQSPPSSSQEWPLSLDNIQEETSGRAAEMIWEKCLYRVLILWLFLQFLNFNGNTGILILIWRDLLLLIIITIIVLTVIKDGFSLRWLRSCAVSVFSDCSEDNSLG